ncbi:MAG: amino acid permease [Acidobacteria bacterium]|nr:amino acid permease [Acidobacteriota bacterium]
MANELSSMTQLIGIGRSRPTVESTTQLKRQLGLASATAMIVGEVIAVGIFLTPAGMAKSLGSPFWILVVWLVMGAMAVCGALCYGALGARFPEAGGSYVYLREAYGPVVAFLYGWKCFLVMDPGITAALAVGLAGYIAYLVNLTPIGAKLVAISAILLIAAVNIVGLRFGAGLMRWLTALKLGSLGLIVVWAIALRLGDLSHFTPFVVQRAGSAPLLGALAGGMVGAFFAFGGWWDLSKLGGEVRDPQRTLPRAMVYGVIGVTLVYVLTSGVFLYLVPLDRVTSGETFAAQAGEALFGRSGGAIFSAIVIVSVLGSLAAVVMSAPRVYYAMARDGVFFGAIAKLHPRFGTPARAVLAEAAMASLLAALGTFNQIVAYFVFVTVIFIALTVASVFRLNRRSGDFASRPVPGYPLTPIVFLSFVALLLFLLAGNNTRQALLGVTIVLLGAPVYYLIFHRQERKNTDGLD